MTRDTGSRWAGAHPAPPLLNHHPFPDDRGLLFRLGVQEEDAELHRARAWKTLVAVSGMNKTCTGIEPPEGGKVGHRGASLLLFFFFFGKQASKKYMMSWNLRIVK